MKQQHDLQLISFDLCPYVERTRIVLAEKGLTFKQTFIDLTNKPDWFLKISPLGKVPVLVVDDRPIFESSVINEFIEELYPSLSMFPSDPIARAQARSWIVYNNDSVMPAAAKVWFATTKEAMDDGAENLKASLAKVEDYFQSREYQYSFFFGDTLGLVDAIYAPLFTRWEFMERLGYTDLLKDFPHIKTYMKNLLHAPSVQISRADHLTEKMLEYVEERAS